MTAPTLGARAVACDGFRLTRQMALVGVLVPAARAIVVAVTATHVLLVDGEHPKWADRPSMDWHVLKSHHGGSVFEYFEPDIANPATQGCILAQASERWVNDWRESTDEQPSICVVSVSTGWRWRLHRADGERFTIAKLGDIVPTYGEACVSALEGSPS